MEYWKGILMFLILAEIIVSCYAVYSDNVETGICLTGGGCKTVKDSEYSNLFGIKVSAFGVIASTSLLLLFFLDYNKKISRYILPLVSLMGAFFAIYFLYAQFFLIGATCSTCLVADTLMLFIAGVSFYNLKMRR